MYTDWLNRIPMFDHSFIHWRFLKHRTDGIQVWVALIITKIQFAQNTVEGAGVVLRADF